MVDQYITHMTMYDPSHAEDIIISVKHPSWIVHTFVILILGHRYQLALGVRS